MAEVQPGLGWMSTWSRWTQVPLLPHLEANKWKNRGISSQSLPDLMDEERKTPHFSSSPALLWFYLAKMNTFIFRLKCLSFVLLIFLFFPFLHIWAIIYSLRCAKLHLLSVRIPPWVTIKQWLLPLSGDGCFNFIGVISSALCGSLCIVCPRL